MAKINELLEEDAHEILKKYQKAKGISRQGDALNSLIKEFGEDKK